MSLAQEQEEVAGFGGLVASVMASSGQKVGTEEGGREHRQADTRKAWRQSSLVLCPALLSSRLCSPQGLASPELGHRQVYMRRGSTALFSTLGPWSLVFWGAPVPNCIVLGV